jgi:predicted metal-dependent hydrolase
MARKPDREWLEDGIALFNAGRFFECHEAWEEIWKRADGEDKRFYQGLIQAAVAILHAQRGNRVGAAKLYAKAFEKLEDFPESHMGLAIGEFRRALDAFFSIALLAPAPAPPTLRPAECSSPRD